MRLASTGNRFTFDLVGEFAGDDGLRTSLLPGYPARVGDPSV